MRILTWDCEVSPNIADVWGLWNNNVSLAQLRESQHMMCWAGKWHGERGVFSFRGEGMIKALHEHLDEADAVVHYNGKSYDTKHAQREFVEAGLGKPSPYAQIDLLQIVRRNFKFPSNKLDYVAGQLLGQRKLQHEGHTLWVKCMAGDEAAWRKMIRYCEQDVRITERLYDHLLGWIEPHPSVPLRDGTESGCPNCGGFSRQHRGYAYTPTRKYVQYRCNNCGRWYRSAHSITATDAR